MKREEEREERRGHGNHSIFTCVMCLKIFCCLRAMNEKERGRGRTKVCARSGFWRGEKKKGVVWSFCTCLISLREKWSFHVDFAKSLMSYPSQILPCQCHVTNHVPRK